MSRPLQFLTLLSAVLAALTGPALADLERRSASTQALPIHRRSPSPKTIDHSDGGAPGVTKGLQCDSQGPFDKYGCCKLPTGPFSVQITDFPKGKCFVVDQDSIEFSWKIVPEISLGHLPDVNPFNYYAHEKKSPDVGTLTPLLAFNDPTLSGLQAFGVRGSPTQPFNACMSAGKYTFKLISDEFNPAYWYGYDQGLNVGWSLFLYTATEHLSGPDYFALDGMNPPKSPFDSFVISDKAGCELYQQRLSGGGGGGAGSTGGGGGGTSGSKKGKGKNHHGH